MAVFCIARNALREWLFGGGSYKMFYNTLRNDT